MTDHAQALRAIFHGLRPVAQTAAAELLAGVDSTGSPVNVVVLTAAGAADPAVRAALARAAGDSAYARSGGGLEAHAADLAAARPWVAGPGRPGQPGGVDSLLAALPAPAPMPPLAERPGSAPAFQPTPWPGAPRDESNRHDQPSPAHTGPPGAAPSRTAAPPGTAGPPGADPQPPWTPAAGWTGPTGPAYGPPAGSRGRLAVVVTAAVALSLLAALGLGLGVWRLSAPVAAPNVPAPNFPAPSLLPPHVSPGPSTGATPPGGGGPVPPGQPPASAEPTLRPTTPVRVVGPSFGASEQTYTMAFPGWPFAFRTPPDWGCLAGSLDLPDARAWVCVDEKNPGARQRVNVMLRPCPTTCTAAEQREMVDAWLDEPDRAVAGPDDRTVYVENQTNARDLYEVDLSRFFAEEAGGRLRWQVGVYVESPAQTRAQVQKVLNDIATQTP